MCFLNMHLNYFLEFVTRTQDCRKLLRKENAKQPFKFSIWSALVQIRFIQS